MSILDTIEADLAAVGGWLETEAQDAAEAVWGDLGALFKRFTAAQLGILSGAVKQLIADVAGDPLVLFTPEALATELLNYVGGQELVGLDAITPALAATLVGAIRL